MLRAKNLYKNHHVRNSYVKCDFHNALIIPKGVSHINSRSDVKVTQDFTFKHSSRVWTGVPLFASNMDTIGTYEMYTQLKTHKIVTCLDKNLNTMFLNGDYDLVPKYYSFSSGTSESDIATLKTLINKYEPFFVCIDVANGYMSILLDRIKELRDAYPNIVIIAGNVVTQNMACKIVEAGADIVKMGIGSGGVCITRDKTGIGYPQMSCIMDSYAAVNSFGGYLMSDGGIRLPADICKAYSAGADFVMMGSMLAGHKECGGEIVGGNMRFYGMSSGHANEKYNGGLSDYKTAEGKEILVPLKDDIHETIGDILGGIRSCCAYVNANNPGEIFENSEFVFT